MVVNQSIFIDEYVFTEYLRGGQLWPQLRGGINIYVMASLFHATDLFSCWKAFVQSQLSPLQLEKAKKTLVLAHRRGGITNPAIVTNEILQKEWRLAKRGVYKSLLYYTQEECPKILDIDTLL